jgi:hypothetical protein
LHNEDLVGSLTPKNKAVNPFKGFSEKTQNIGDIEKEIPDSLHRVFILPQKISGGQQEKR